MGPWRHVAVHVAGRDGGGGWGGGARGAGTSVQKHVQRGETRVNLPAARYQHQLAVPGAPRGRPEVEAA